VNEWTHLGDGLYAKYDGWQIELRANDPNEPENDTVYLEFETAIAFIKYAKRVFDVSESWLVDYVSSYAPHDNCSVCGLPIADDEDVHDDYGGQDCHAACCPVCKDDGLNDGYETVDQESGGNDG